MCRHDSTGAYTSRCGSGDVAWSLYVWPAYVDASDNGAGPRRTCTVRAKVAQAPHPDGGQVISLALRLVLWLALSALAVFVGAWLGAWLALA